MQICYETGKYTVFHQNTEFFKSRFVMGLENILFAGMHVCAIQQGNVTGWGSEGVKGKVQWLSALWKEDGLSPTL